MLSLKKTHTLVVPLFFSCLLGANLVSSKAEAGGSFFGGFVVGTITGVVVSHVIHNEWHQGRRSYKRSASAKQQSRLPQQSSSSDSMPEENVTTVAKTSGPSADDTNFRPSLQPTSASLKKP